MKLVALIKPKGLIFREIKNLKIKIFKKIGHQTYLNHFPHITIFSIDVFKKKINLQHKKKINLKKIKKKKLVLNIKKRHYFKNDPLTKKVTFAIFLKKSFELSSIQKYLLMNFKNIINYKKKIVKNNFDRNFNLYGYHFVNSSWKPHITIASVNKIKSENKIFSEFLKNKKIYSENFSHIYFYEFVRGKHKFLWKSEINYE